MRSLTAALILAGAVLSSAAASSQSLYREGRTAWHSGHYPLAHDILLEYRKSPYGRRPDVDFMLGTSGCRMASRRAWGGDVLDWMLYAYALTYESRQVVAHERDLCRSAQLASLVEADVGSIVEERAAGMTGYGKTFYWAERDNQPVASYPIRRVRDLPRDELVSRRVPLDDPERALALADELSPGSRAAALDRVLVVSDAGHNAEELRSIGRTVSRYIGFLEEIYGIQPPQHFLTVYLVDSPNAVRAKADRLHGLDVSEATVGYAFVDDASVVAAVSGTAIGTVLHELFHLIVRANFGDIPQWLDEGMAALYEVSGRRGDRYFGLDNWRGRVLQELWELRPTINELIRTEWFLFDDPGQARLVEQAHDGAELFYIREEGRRQAAMMAMARYFLLYLEQRGELVPVYIAIRDRGFAELSGDARDHVVSLVQSTLGRSVEDLDADFSEWFRSGGPEAVAAMRRPLTSGGERYVATANVNIRTGPGTDFERLGLLSEGHSVAVFGKRSGWAEIRMDDGTLGFISLDYLRSYEAASAGE